MSACRETQPGNVKTVGLTRGRHASHEGAFTDRSRAVCRRPALHARVEAFASLREAAPRATVPRPADTGPLPTHA